MVAVEECADADGDEGGEDADEEEYADAVEEMAV